jgi:hypothetical protein
MRLSYTAIYKELQPCAPALFAFGRDCSQKCVECKSYKRVSNLFAQAVPGICDGIGSLGPKGSPSAWMAKDGVAKFQRRRLSQWPRDENNLVYSERVQVYKVPIRAVKVEIVAIAPALEQQHMTEYCPVKEYGGMV